MTLKSVKEVVGLGIRHYNPMDIILTGGYRILPGFEARFPIDTTFWRMKTEIDDEIFNYCSGLRVTSFPLGGPNEN